MLYRVYKGLHAKAHVLLEKSNILIVCEQILLTLLLCCILCCLSAPQADLKRYRLVSTQNEISKTRRNLWCSLQISDIPIDGHRYPYLFPALLKSCGSMTGKPVLD